MNIKMPTQIEPKKVNRFIVDFPEKFEIEPWTVQKIDKPNFTENKWENIRVDFIDPIGPSASKGLYKIIKFLEENKNSNNKMFDIFIKSLDPTGVVVEEWVVSVQDVLTINFGKLDYGNDDIQKPFLILQPLNCFLNY